MKRSICDSAEHYAVVTKQRGRLIGPACESCIEISKYCDATVPTTRPRNSPFDPLNLRAGYGPDAGLAIPGRFAEHRAQSRVGLQRLKIVLTCEIEWWGWPGPRRMMSRPSAPTSITAPM